ncbi:divergent polysaccharide deacetylase family protein [Pararhizobium sp.]|uniref:divergent polysaccharide deacetylase family protein n=1 Tax=Pararhizobium sp. TaxID=1977563 RepID=UPI002715F584|nr:divergent polysaccharide deacetylase family protein [Pararhizobium sp.]MDO9416724.1 divergent polysaccharide deacetylase family protein [Pararhizobium sp.]
METDLNAPIGQNRKSAPARRLGGGSRWRYGAGLAVIALVAGSAWVAILPSGLRSVAETVPEVKTEPVPVETAEDVSKKPDAQEKQGLQRQSGLSGAKVEETLTNDGSIVRKFSPGTRDEDGPVILGTGRTRGQDLKQASFPNDDLLEDSADGRLPITGPDGLRPLDQYARPWSGARGTRIAIVVGGLGLSQTGTQRAIRELPEEITLGFAASGNSLQRWMQQARQGGHEILLQIPFEPFDYPDNNPGPNTLRVGLDAKQNLSQLHQSMAEITNYTGIMNFLGGRFLSDADALEPVMRDLSKRGLLFLDDGTSAQSLTGTLASTLRVPHAFGDVVLDGQINKTAILTKLDELERIALRKGTAIGTASAFDESVDAIAEWSAEAAKRGIEIVGVSAAVNDPQQQ